MQCILRHSLYAEASTHVKHRNVQQLEVPLQIDVETPTSQLPFLCPYTSQHTDLVNSSLTTTANHSLIPSFSLYFHKQNGP